MVIGEATKLLLLSIGVMRTNWHKQSDVVIAATAIEESSEFFKKRLNLICFTIVLILELNEAAGVGVTCKL